MRSKNKLLKIPKLISSKVFYDKRGYLIETISRKKYLNVKFSILTVSKKNI